MTCIFSGSGSLQEDTISSGVPSFVVKEFELYTGYWWEPMATRDITPDVTSGDTTQTYILLYEEVDESEVDIIQVI